MEVCRSGEKRSPSCGSVTTLPKICIKPQLAQLYSGWIKREVGIPMSRASPGKGLLEWAGLNLSFRRKPDLFMGF